MRHLGNTIFAALTLLGLSTCDPIERNYVPPSQDAITTASNELEPYGDPDAGSPSLPKAPARDASMLPSTAANGDSAAKAKGTACSRASECESRYCVDGLCCERPCADVCSTCAAPGSEGTCSPTSIDVNCGTLSCGQAGDCRGYDLSQTQLNCAAIGQCLTEITCEALDQPDGFSCEDSTGTCTDNGACLVPGKALLGAGCETSDDCSEGHCVTGPDGARLCCDSNCDGLCQACSADGHCNASPPSDSRCSEVSCPDDSVCRDYEEPLTESLCRGFGQCKDVVDCSYVALRPTTSCACDAEGNCELLLGQRCVSDEQCGLAACEEAIDGGSRCSTEACGPGLASNLAGTACVFCAEDNIACDADTQLTCVQGEAIGQACSLGCTDGLGCNTEAPLGYLCDNADCQQGSVCQQDTGGEQRCCSRNCAAESKQCALDGSCICPPGQSTDTDDSCLLQQGDPCSNSGTACQNGLTCVDGVCCNTDCGESCATCNAPGSVGQCVYDAQDNGSCSVGEACFSQGDCRAELGEACAQGNACLSSNCSARIGDGASVCCAQTCGGNSRCSSDGNRCVQCESNDQCPNGCNTNQGICNPLRPTGSTCDISSQCDTGICSAVEGGNRNRCCPNCGGGQVCDASGQCGCPNNQVFVNGQCRRLNGQTCAAGQDFSCQSGNCEATVDGSNACCTDNCATGTQLCAANGGGCVDQGGAVGDSCNTGGDCLNGNCVDNFCCNQACRGQCERCNAPGSQGSCSEDRGNSCQAGRTCFGRGQCLATIGQTCNNVGCGEGSCENTLANGAAICCEEACSARRPFCSVDARECTQSNGGSCQQDNDCDSGECSGGTCCSQACPAIDCGQFSDPNNPCETFPIGLVTTNLCDNGGSCRSAEQVCNGLRQTSGGNVSCVAELSLGLTLTGTCDGSGECRAPEVSCGNQNCSLEDQVCCQARDTRAPAQCVQRGAQGTQPTGVNCSLNSDRVISCDHPGDCPAGSQCCSQDGQGGNRIQCTSALCLPAGAESNTLAPLCRSPAQPGQFLTCPAGSACEPIDANNDYFECQLRP